MSSCRTRTLLNPSTAVNISLQVEPSVEYSTRAPSASPVTDSRPSAVIPSPGSAPLSLRSATTGAWGDCESSVKLKAVGSEAFPAASVWRMRKALCPSTALHCVLHVDPSSVEYSTIEPSSIVELDPVISTRKPVGPPQLTRTKSSVLIPSMKPPLTVNGSNAQ